MRCLLQNVQLCLRCLLLCELQRTPANRQKVQPAGSWSFIGSEGKQQRPCCQEKLLPLHQHVQPGHQKQLSHADVLTRTDVFISSFVCVCGVKASCMFHTSHPSYVCV